jgi:NAD+ kinase
MPAPTPSLRFRRVALVGRYASPALAEPLAGLAAFLAARGHEIVLESETARYAPVPGCRRAEPGALGQDADVAIVVGGDGTMLSAARELGAFDIPLIGVNQGRLGFLTDVPAAAMEPALAAILDGRFVEERRTMLDVVLERKAGGPSDTAQACNEVVVNRGTQGGMIDSAAEIDGRFLYAMRSDGLIVATPTGSTAYALSAQGPIVEPSVPAILLVPVAPHALTNRPIVVGDSVTIRVTLLRGSDAWAHCDGQTHFQMAEGDRVTIRRAQHSMRLLHPEGYDYFAMLREKLHWSETPERLHETAFSGRAG